MSPVEEQQHQSPDDDEYTYLSRESPGCIQEEVHGVNCVTPEETPELLRTSLAKLATILDSNDVIPEQDKKSYLASQKLKSSSSSSTTCCCYVNTDDFRLRFLRAELFDVHRAARTLTKFLNLVEAVFGSFALERPVRLDDFDKDELKALRKGCIQFLPIRDRSGRRIMIVFPGDEMEKIDRSVRLKICLYFAYLVGTNDIHTQRNGMVLVFWAPGVGDFRTDWSIYTHLREARPVRLSAIHLCSLDNPFFRVLQKVFMNSLVGNATKMDARYRIHFGEPTELHYALQTFGIPIDKIPITLSRTIKLVYLNQWLWIRQYIEQGLSIIECPGTYDVVSRQGTAAMYYPGNAWFIDLIQSKFEAHLMLLLQKEEQEGVGYCKCNSNSNTTSNTASCNYNFYAINDRFKLTYDLMESIVSELMQCIQETSGRILTWYDNRGYGCVGWWTVLDDPQQIHNKVEYLVTREFKKFNASITRAHRNQKRKESSSYSCSSSSKATTSPAIGRKKILQQVQSQVLQSDTSIFRLQDGTTGKAMFCCSRE